MRESRPLGPPPYFNRRDQLRLMMLCALLFLVLLSIDAARKPANWNWFFTMGAVEDHGASGLSLKELDFRTFPVREEIRNRDEFLVSGDAETLRDAAPAEPAGGLEESSEQSGLERFEHPQLMLLQDQRLGFLRSEQPVFQAVIDQLRGLNEADLQTAASPASFRVVNSEPEQHRGRLFSLEGTLRQYLPVSGSMFGDDDPLWQGWLFTPDSGTNPWLVLCVEPTPDLAIGERIEQPVRVAGYFLKRHGYPTSNGSHVAPLLLARRFQVFPQEQSAVVASSNEGVWYLASLVLLISVSLTVLVWRFRVSDRRYSGSRAAKIAAERFDPGPGGLSIPQETDGSN